MHTCNEAMRALATRQQGPAGRRSSAEPLPAVHAVHIVRGFSFYGFHHRASLFMKIFMCVAIWWTSRLHARAAIRARARAFLTMNPILPLKGGPAPGCRLSGVAQQRGNPARPDATF